MKKIILLLIAGTLLYACKKESTGQSTTISRSTLVGGRWNIQKDSFFEYTSGKLHLYVDSSYNGDTWLTFNADGTGVNNSTKFTYTLSGSQMAFSYASFVENGVNNEARTDKGTIIKLNDHFIEWIYDYTTTTNGLRNGELIRETAVR